VTRCDRCDKRVHHTIAVTDQPDIFDCDLCEECYRRWKKNTFEEVARREGIREGFAAAREFGPTIHEDGYWRQQVKYETVEEYERTLDTTI